ncbi:uncharacterized protein LOC62_05G006896 [Vanrija pseudolonga]|uniref:Uncharacterized protein n=1 Tax=Vanrija pseudolonga TaxID=143232 RepID=A0AAF0YCD1_9TREE|nr:hypothetical protein LOC62_05G006896 [Vanrija pseudolonga]
MLFAATSILALAGLAQAQDVLFTGTNFRATVYYDLDTATDICAQKNGGPFASNWAVDTGINGGVTYCQGSTSTAWTLDSLHTNRIVAMNYTMVSGDKEKWCGKEVQIFGPDGKEITIDEGPFVLFDGCAACMSTGIIDLSAKAFAAVKGGTCAGNNPEGLTIKVLGNNVSPSGSVGGGSPPATAAPPAPTASSTQAAPAPSSTYSVRGANAWWSGSSSAAPSAGVTAAVELNAAVPPPSNDPTPSPTAAPVGANDAAAAAASPDAASTTLSAAPTTTAADKPSSAPAPEAAAPAPSSQAPAVAAPAAAPSPVSAGACQFGTWACNGLKIQVCNFIDTKNVGWETIATCDNECSFTNTGSVICQ